MSDERNTDPLRHGGQQEGVPDIWHDPDGVWADAGTGTLGPFKDEDEATRAYAIALIEPASDALARRTDDIEAQGLAADLNLALRAIRSEGPS